MASVTRPCACGSGLERWPEADAQGIFLCYVCDKCRAKKLAFLTNWARLYRPEILTGYTQADVDEPIEPED